MFKIKYLLWGIIALLVFITGMFLTQRFKSAIKAKKTASKSSTASTSEVEAEAEDDGIRSYKLSNMDEISRAIPMGEYVIPIRDGNTSQIRYVSESFFTTI